MLNKLDYNIRNYSDVGNVNESYASNSFYKGKQNLNESYNSFSHRRDN